MPIDKTLRYLLVINPVSGGNEKDELVDATKKFLEDQGHTAECMVLAGDGDDKKLQAAIKSCSPDRVIAIGGDGTLKLVAEQLAGTDTPVGLLPAGSANGMARELGLPANPMSCLEILTGDNIKSLDAIMVNDKELCLHLSDIGLNAQLVKKFEQSDTRGKWTYIREIFGVLLRRKQLKLRINVDGAEYRRKAFMIVIANARMYGTGAMINPEGDLFDGKMEVVVLKRISFWELAKMFAKYRHFNPRKTEILQGERVSIVSEKDAWFQVDGEYLGKMRQVSARVMPHALKMLLPD
jgi:diacylglycerol kinase (ATP)